MTILVLVELDVDDIRIDETLFPNLEKSGFIYKHLRHYCSKFSIMPSLYVKVYPDTVVVIRGHHYLLIARYLGHQRIRAIVDHSSLEKDVQAFLQKPSVSELNWKLAKEESEIFCEYIWYVFFFERPLNQEEKKIFEETVVSFFTKLNFPAWIEMPEYRLKHLNYPYFGKCAEFNVFVPIADESWYPYSRIALIQFHLNCVQIISFQGRKWRI